MRTLINDTPKKIGDKVTLFGWVHVRRDHGRIIFIDVRDRTGIVQVVFNPKNEALLKKADTLRSEWVIRLEGEVKARPEKMINKELPTGTVEIEVLNVEVLAEAETPPFAFDTDGYEVSEDIRMKYRYLDLRRKRLQKNLEIRSLLHLFIRNFLHTKGFIEIETPILTKATPEGARDYVVPSRLQKGKFYALPQSPQQYKQLLMVAGIEKYFQIARCFRDEDTRGDRQPEFTQLDIEMSFISQEDVLSLTEEMYSMFVEKFYPEKKISKPFLRMTYDEAMEQYKSDRPDMRKNKNDTDELAFVWVTDFPMFEKHEDGSWTAQHHPFTLPRAKAGGDVLSALKEGKNLSEFYAHQYDLVLNGEEIGGGSIRISDPRMLEAVFERLGHSKEEIQNKFGHILDAFTYGVPPHGGIALGLDRLHMVLCNEQSIREVIAFPKTGDGRDLMMNAPAELSEEQLKELGIEIRKRK